MSGISSSVTAPSAPFADVQQALAELREHGPAWRPLEGKILALISSSDQTEDALRFRAAATALGARVAWMRPGFSLEGNVELIRSTSRVLGKLYDAIEFQSEDGAVIPLIREAAGIPVFDYLAAPQPVEVPVETSEQQLRLLQARLLIALG